MSAKNVMKMIEDNEVKFIDFRFTDTIGKEQHVSVPAHTINAEKLENNSDCISVKLSCQKYALIAT
jgi:glutamine synthetase